jgi:hypothetical protein
MSRLKTPAPRRKSSPARAALTLDEALLRVDNPHIAEALSVLFAHLSRAQAQEDSEGVKYVQRAIIEAMRGDPDEPIDMPLSDLFPELHRKRSRR